MNEINLLKQASLADKMGNYRLADNLLFCNPNPRSTKSLFPITLGVNLNGSFVVILIVLLFIVI